MPESSNLRNFDLLWRISGEFCLWVKADDDFFGLRKLGFGILRILSEVDSEILDENNKWRTKGLWERVLAAVVSGSNWRTKSLFVPFPLQYGRNRCPEGSAMY